MQILSSIGSVAARMPLVDAGIGLIPGIAAMSRIVNNAELNALNHGAAIVREDYFAVFSTFKIEDVGWKCWRLFNKLKAVDSPPITSLFEQGNDLVVDTSSMTYYTFGPTPDLQRLQPVLRLWRIAAGPSHGVFRDPQTLDFIAKSLGFR